MNNVAVPANREITVATNSQTANQAVVLVVFCDSDNNNQLNLDVDDVPTEVFGVGGVQLIVPAEASDLQTGSAEVAIHVDLINLFTSADSPLPPVSPTNTFNYDDNDEYDYDSSGITIGNLSLAEFKEYLSGAVTGQINDPDLQSGRRGVELNAGPCAPFCAPGTVLGDVVDFTYRSEPAGVSSFDLARDVPDAPMNVTATIGDPDEDGDSEVVVTWDGVSNPDLAGYDVFVREVINGIPTADWVGPINETIVEGESFTGEIDGPTNPFESDSTFQVVVLATNDADPTAANGFGDYGPDSNVETVVIPVVENPLPLVSEETEVVDNGTGGELDDDDVLRIEFAQDIAVAANASVTLKDIQDGEFATVTCGANAVCTVGPSDTLTMTLSADPSVAGGIGGNGALEHDEAVVTGSTGITSASNGSAWHLPGSGIEKSVGGLGTATGALEADSLTRVFDESEGIEEDNSNLPEAIDPADVNAEDDSATLTVDPDADVNSDIDQGDVVQVYNLAGVLVGSAPWDTTVGAQINIGTLPAGTPLVVLFIDDDGADNGGVNTDIPSASTLVFVVGDEPIVIAVNTVDLNTIDVVWLVQDPPLTQVGPASNYRVFDSDNTDLVRTGQTAVVVAPDTVRVDLDGNLVVGTDYFLRVAANTVQNNNNVPNDAQAVPFTLPAGPRGPEPAAAEHHLGSRGRGLGHHRGLLHRRRQLPGGERHHGSRLRVRRPDGGER